MSQPRARRLGLVMLSLLIALAPTAEARGKKKKPTAAERARTDSRVHFDEAQKLFALGRFADALVEYELAYELAPLPGLLLNIAQCHRNLDHLDAAVFSYRKYLQLVPEAAKRAQIEATIEELEAETQRRADEQARADEELRAKIDATLVVAPTPARRRPIYRRWWFITGAAVVVTAAATGTAILLTRDELPDSDLGVVDFRR